MSLIAIAVAVLGGAAIGLERQWSGHATGPDARFGGIRTLALLGGLGGVAGGLALGGYLALAIVLLAASAAIVVLGYAARSRHDVDATTEVSGLVVVAAGMLAGMGKAQEAAGLIAITAVLLIEKGRLHALAARIDDETLRASARFALLALVVLPLLPTGPFGPFDAIRPRSLWMLVLFFSALSFAAWIGRRLLGATQGTVAAGFLGGIISSTSVTLAFARMSRTRPGELPLALAAVAACTVMLVRVAIASAVLDLPVSRAFIPYAAPAFLIGIAVLGATLRRTERLAQQAPIADGSPLQLGVALQMAAMFQVVLLLVSAVVAWWSVRALMLTSALVGLTDLDALTLSLTRSSGLAPAQAARALAVGVLANTLLKMTIAAVVGRGRYQRLVTVVLGLMAAAVAGSLLI